MKTYKKYLRIGHLIIILTGIVLNAYSNNRKQWLEDSIKCRSVLTIAKGLEYESPDSCISHLNKALDYAYKQKIINLLPEIMYRLGYMYHFYKQNEELAENFLNNATKIGEPYSDYASLGLSYGLLAIMAKEQKSKNSIVFVERALANVIFLKDNRTKATVLTNVGIYYKLLEDYNKALYYLSLALGLYKISDIDDWFSESLTYYDLLIELGKTKQAKSVLEDLRRNISQLKKTKGEFIYMNDIAEFNLKAENYKKAESILLQIFKKEQSKGDSLHLYYILRNLKKTYVGQQNFEQALKTQEQWFKIYVWLNKKRQKEDIKLQLARKEAKLEAEKQEIKIKLLTSEKQFQEVIISATIMLIILSIGVAFYLQNQRKLIREQKEKYEQLSNTKDKLFSIIAHDLRSPLSELSNYALLHNWGMLKPKDLTQVMPVLNNKLKNILTILDNLLQWGLSQMNGILPHFETVNFNPLIEEIVRSITSTAELKKIQINTNVEAGLKAEVDKNHLTIILRNLLQNAIKFSHINSIISIYSTISEHQFSIFVVDRGIGMSENIMKNLFEVNRFVSKVGTNYEKGTGLGLTVVKELAELNNIQLNIQSKEGEGSIFSLTFKGHVPYATP